jgi:hypothetical protein
MTTRYRQICNRCGLDCEATSIVEAHCNAEGCTAVERVQAPGMTGHDVPPGWVRGEVLAREVEGRPHALFSSIRNSPSIATTTLHYCPAHVPEAIAAATARAK